jgi:hypothetical protein
MTAEDSANLKDLAAMVMTDLELRLEAAAGQRGTPVSYRAPYSASNVPPLPLDSGVAS